MPQAYCYEYFDVLEALTECGLCCGRGDDIVGVNTASYAWRGVVGGGVGVQSAFWQDSWRCRRKACAVGVQSRLYRFVGHCGRTVSSVGM